MNREDYSARVFGVIVWARRGDDGGGHEDGRYVGGIGGVWCDCVVAWIFGTE